MNNVKDVLTGTSRWAVECEDALVFLRGQPDNSVDLVFTSPPYSDARTYGIAADKNSAVWVEWMRPIVREACRVSTGLVFLNVSDRVEDCRYGGGPEWLFADLTRLDGLTPIRPYAWVKSGPGFDDPGNGQPGSGGRHFHRSDWEPVYGYAEPAKLPPRWSDNTAFGHAPIWKSGGRMSNRDRDGQRATNGRMVNLGAAGQPGIANPGNVIRVLVGGGHLGHDLAHETDAPMPLKLAERFVCWFCPPNGVVLDPFTGSGTTCHAAIMHGRRFVGSDIRQKECDLTRRRMESVTPSMFAAVID